MHQGVAISHMHATDMGLDRMTQVSPSNRSVDQHNARLPAMIVHKRRHCPCFVVCCKQESCRDRASRSGTKKFQDHSRCKTIHVGAHTRAWCTPILTGPANLYIPSHLTSLTALSHWQPHKQLPLPNQMKFCVSSQTD